MDRRSVLIGIGVLAATPTVAQTRSKEEWSQVVSNKATDLLNANMYILHTAYTLRTQSTNLTPDQIFKLQFIEEKCRTDVVNVINDLYKIASELYKEQKRSKEEWFWAVGTKADALIMTQIGPIAYNLRTTQSNNLTPDQISKLIFIEEKCRTDVVNIINDLYKIASELYKEK